MTQYHLPAIFDFWPLMNWPSLISHLLQYKPILCRLSAAFLYWVEFRFRFDQISQSGPISAMMQQCEDLGPLNRFWSTNHAHTIFYKIFYVKNPTWLNYCSHLWIARIRWFYGRTIPISERAGLVHFLAHLKGN